MQRGKNPRVNVRILPTRKTVMRPADNEVGADNLTSVQISSGENCHENYSHENWPNLTRPDSVTPVCIPEATHFQWALGDCFMTCWCFLETSIKSVTKLYNCPQCRLCFTRCLFVCVFVCFFVTNFTYKQIGSSRTFHYFFSILQSIDTDDFFWPLSSGAYSAFQLTRRESGVSLLARTWYDPKECAF